MRLLLLLTAMMLKGRRCAFTCVRVHWHLCGDVLLAAALAAIPEFRLLLGNFGVVDE
jgi:hypothetical protein